MTADSSADCMTSDTGSGRSARRLAWGSPAVLVWLVILSLSCVGSHTSPTTSGATDPAPGIVLDGLSLLAGGGSFSRMYRVCGGIRRSQMVPTDVIVLHTFDVSLRDRDARSYYTESFTVDAALGTGRAGCFGNIHDPIAERIAMSFRIRVVYSQGGMSRSVETTGVPVQQ